MFICFKHLCLLSKQERFATHTIILPCYPEILYIFFYLCVATLICDLLLYPWLKEINEWVKKIQQLIMCSFVWIFGINCTWLKMLLKFISSTSQQTFSSCFLWFDIKRNVLIDKNIFGYRDVRLWGFLFVFFATRGRIYFMVSWTAVDF